MVEAKGASVGLKKCRHFRDSVASSHKNHARNDRVDATTINTLCHRFIPCDALNRPMYSDFSLSFKQRALLDRYKELLVLYNQRVNLISRSSEKDIERHHIQHSLFLARKPFSAGSVVVDWGTGGGLPGIPLAVCFPDVKFQLVESRARKAAAVSAIVRELKLANIDVWDIRAENWKGAATHSVSRATAPLATLWKWHQGSAGKNEGEAVDQMWRPGLLCLKGGHLKQEIDELRGTDASCRIEKCALSTLSSDPFFDDKFIIHVF